MTEKNCKLAIVDDYEIFRQGLQVMLKKIKCVQIIDSCESGLSFLEKLPLSDPDIVLMDIKMPGIDGIETTRRALTIKPSLKVVALSTFGEEEHLHGMINAGACGFLLKNITGEKLEFALKTIIQGNQYYSEELLQFFTKRFINAEEKPQDDFRLTKRELEVLEMVAQGCSNQEIADKLFISIRTVDGHKNNLIVKTGSRNVVDLLIYAIKSGILKI
ncbi:MAG: response regulator transcription factor [Bacteroidales bacterium]|nr:response regulator transcription factor [Bacteroidales bacterium]